MHENDFSFSDKAQNEICSILEKIYSKYHTQSPVVHGLIKAYDWVNLFKTEAWQVFFQYFIRQTIMAGGMTPSFKVVYIYFPNQTEKAMKDMKIPVPYRC